MCEEIIKLALLEDLKPNGDLSSLLIPDFQKKISARLIAKADGVMACGHLVQKILDSYQELLVSEFQLEPLERAEVQVLVKDGAEFRSGDILFTINSSAILALGAERTILNFLQRLSGIASATKKLNDLIKDFPVKLLDTRKTMPGLRALEKEAFRAGGGTNHRASLSSMIMLKENHLAVLGLDLITSVRAMRTQLAEKNLSEIKIEIEINSDNLSKLGEILKEKIDIIMLDNFSPDAIRPILSQIRQARPEIMIEASGGINKTNIIDYAKTGVDYISVGSVFTQSNNVDISIILQTTHQKPSI